MILLFTDFGSRDPYVGQLKARLATEAPGHLVVDLLHEAPDYNPLASAHLLAALATGYPAGSVFIAVVDPGVGTARDGLVAMAGGHWFVGPDNGLLSVVAARHPDTRIWKITWQPPGGSTTFHGRDIFAPVAAAIASGVFPHDKLALHEQLAVRFDAGDLPQVVYLDHFGNAWTGIRTVAPESRVSAGGHDFSYSASFGFVGEGQGFWFINSVGLLELAVNRGSAAETFGLKLGDRVEVSQRF